MIMLMDDIGHSIKIKSHLFRKEAMHNVMFSVTVGSSSQVFQDFEQLC